MYIYMFASRPLCRWFLCRASCLSLSFHVLIVLKMFVAHIQLWTPSLHSILDPWKLEVLTTNVGRLTKYQAQMVSSRHSSREILGRYHDSTWPLSCGTRSPFGHILWGVAFTDTGWMWTSMFWEQDIYRFIYIYICIVDVCKCSCSIRI